MPRKNGLKQPDIELNAFEYLIECKDAKVPKGPKSIGLWVKSKMGECMEKFEHADPDARSCRIMCFDLQDRCMETLSDPKDVEIMMRTAFEDTTPSGIADLAAHCFLTQINFDHGTELKGRITLPEDREGWVWPILHADPPDDRLTKFRTEVFKTLKPGTS